MVDEMHMKPSSNSKCNTKTVDQEVVREQERHLSYHEKSRRQRIPESLKSVMVSSVKCTKIKQCREIVTRLSLLISTRLTEHSLKAGSK